MPRLTPISIEKMRPRPQRYAVPDSGCRGLYLNVYPTGRKSWSVRYRFNGATRNFTLDGSPSLAEARKAATSALAQVAQGQDPAAVKRVAKTAPVQRAPDTIQPLVARFVEQHAKRKTRANSWRATQGIFNRIVLPAWIGRNVHDIRRRDVIDLLEGIAGDRPIMANRTHAALSRFFRWLCERDVIEASPMVGISLPSSETERDRALSDSELTRLWKACEAIGGREGACVKLLILTGQRRNEIAKLRWREVGSDVLELSAERMKGKRPHIVPLSTQAAGIIASMPQLMPQVPAPDGYVFGRPINHFDRIKRKLDEHMGDTPKFVIHDIRRSVASGMARIGIAVPTIEKVLAHRSGTFRGIVGTYQRHSFLPEMADALQRWADHIEDLVSDRKAVRGQVVDLRRRRK